MNIPLGVTVTDWSFETGKEFALTIAGEIAGDRLFRGDDNKTKNGIWPFRKPGWMYYSTRKEAEAAAKKLNAYFESKKKARK